ncbi:C4-dicarboxylate ABC transporter permease [Clostridiales bacterium PH28_bin88]|nr:C4-dicarboxylate ABC transporter permease [Clostridiales bacterium PH28_bin88]
MIVILSFLVIVLVGLPIAFSFGVASLLYLLSQSMPLTVLVSRTFGAIDSFPLMAIPFFVYSGDLMKGGGISKALTDFVYALIGRVKGALAHVTVIACLFFGAISGSSAATVAAIGGIMIPEMTSRGYNRAYASAIAAAAGFLGILIPPSIPLVVYGLNASASIGELFLGGVGPGLVMGFAFMIVNYLTVDKYQESSREEQALDEKAIRPWEATKQAIPALIMPVIILGGIYGGVFTPTEAGAVAVIYAILVGGLYYRIIERKNFLSISKDSAVTSSIILIIIAFAGIFGWVITTRQVPNMVAEFVTGMTTNKYVILLLINVFLLFLGMIMETVTAIVITTPILLPLVTRVGVDPVHFGVVMVVNLCVGLITPPMALNLLLASRIGKVSISEIVKPLWPYLWVAVAVLFLVTYVPSITLFLPNLLLK